MPKTLHPPDGSRRTIRSEAWLARRLVVADGAQLPFADASCSYVIAMHVLEHAIAPVGSLFHGSFAASPLMRLWWAAHRPVWHHSVPWSGQLDVVVDGESGAPATAAYDQERTAAALAAAHASGRARPLPAAVR
jgi:hypothetical protein